MTRVVPPLGVFLAVGDGIEGLVHNTALDRTAVLAVEIVDITSSIGRFGSCRPTISPP
ncbi:hypothetical protein [Plantactinospora sp. BC1]|uniref:hypothetical protein n=1 Tax=Plantactinospora sp. BC1 TaxID=2108470 RepID=UPI00131EE56A|nr:hypothetical protein [Plantactinospora sp. BC1]